MFQKKAEPVRMTQYSFYSTPSSFNEQLKATKMKNFSKCNRDKWQNNLNESIEEIRKILNNIK